MSYREKPCAICQKPFIPNSGVQIICEKCRPIYNRSNNGKVHSVEEARKAYVAEHTKGTNAEHTKSPDAYFEPGCDGCKYWRPMTGGFNACHYCIDREELRHCKPGKDCTVRVEKKQGETFRKPLTLV